ncbi:MAG: FecCD family ABC transporter permease [Mycobacteriaceae bacterium]
MSTSPVTGRRPVRIGPISGVWRPRAVLVPVALVAAVVLLLALNVGRGDFPVSVPDVLNILLGGGNKAQRFIVMELRLPRSLSGVLVGLALGMSGAITQSITRNPLASPDILGITAGAGVAAVAVIVFGSGVAGGLLTQLGLPISALLGGVLTAVAIYLLAWRGGVQGFRLVLVGIAVGAMLTSLTSYLLLRAEITGAAQAAVWLIGSLNGRGWDHVVPVTIAVAVAGAFALVMTFTLGALRLGDDSARALGVRLQRGQGALLLAAVVLASVAVAAAGPIGFVAFVAPHIALRLVRSAGPPVLASGLVGAALVIGSDVVARSLLPVELPVGIVTAAIGGPYLLVLLLRQTRKSSA